MPDDKLERFLKFKTPVRRLESFDTDNMLLTDCVGFIINAVHRSTLQPVTQEIIREFGDEFETAVDYYKEFQGVDPYIMRWGNTIVYFDKNNLPPIVAKIKELIESGKVTAEEKNVTDYIRANPDKVKEMYRGDSFFLVWIENELFAMHKYQWIKRFDGIDEYLKSWAMFNTTFSVWQK